MASRPDIEYIGLDLTLIGCIEIFVVYISEIIRRIEMIQMYRDDTNISDIMQVTRPLRLRLRLR